MKCQARGSCETFKSFSRSPINNPPSDLRCHKVSELNKQINVCLAQKAFPNMWPPVLSPSRSFCSLSHAHNRRILSRSLQSNPHPSPRPSLEKLNFPSLAVRLLVNFHFPKKTAIVLPAAHSNLYRKSCFLV
jgi:hypothetical protein